MSGDKIIKPNQKTIDSKRIAIVHDALVVAGGAERLTAILSLTFPDADIYTSAYLSEKTYPYFKTKKIHTLPGARLVKDESQFKRLFPLWFLGFRGLDLSGYDLVISSSTYLAKFLRTPKCGKHICYLHSPFRFLWKRESYSPESLPFNRLVMSAIDLVSPLIQKLDKHYTDQISYLITNSQNTANFIHKVHNRDAEVIYPPVEVNQYRINTKRKDYYLVVSRLISYKRIDLAIRACEQTHRKLLVVGDGPERGPLQNITGEYTSFIGKIGDEELKKLYAEARGLIFPGMDDFGMTPIEAQASGCPVIAFHAGGAIETVIENETGVFFQHQTVADLIAGLDRFEKINFDPQSIRQLAMRFDVSVFQSKMRDYVRSVM